MLTRRQTLAAGLASPLLLSSESLAQTQTGERRQAPAHYRVRSGAFTVTALCDGYVELPHNLFPNATDQTAADLAAKAFISPGKTPTAVNAFVLQNRERAFLIDAGLGSFRTAATGRLAGEMRLAGIDPSSISVVLLTHLHTDHCGGLVDKSGARAFPNAEIFVPEPEVHFWTDEGLPSRAPEMMQPMIKIANAVLAAYKGRITSFAPGSEPIPGVQSVKLFGHTPGHTGFVIGTGDDALFVWGDIIHLAALQFAHPEWGLAFDVDQAAAAATRARIFDQAATDRLRVAGMHLSFPGLGHLARDGAAYRYVPSEWRPFE